MKEKFSKYWENLGKLNFLLYVAVILDQRYKLKFVKWCLDQVYATEIDTTMGTIMFEEVKKTFNRLYNCYATDDVQSSDMPSCSSSRTDAMDADNFGTSSSLTSQFASFLEETEFSDNKSEIDKYLDDKCVKESASFDILEWWNKNSKEFPNLARMARDVLSVPVSTVASESTFSTGGRILSPYRSSLNPEMVEALVCCQNWLRSSHGTFDVQESMKEVPADEAKKYDDILRGTCMCIKIITLLCFV